MKIKFTKMTGAGNDFVCIDNRSGKIKLSKKQRAALCDRYFGVGADGLLLLGTPKPKAKNLVDFEMRYYNSDGGEADMCGNGARCFANFAKATAGVKKRHISFTTRAGVIGAEFVGSLVRITLTPPHGLRLGIPLKLSFGKLTAHSLDTGVPHVVIFVRDLEKIDLEKHGREVRFHKAFQPKGTNVNFVQMTGEKSIRVRTYERGVENETLACGTGLTASALVASVCKKMKSPITVKVQGGDTLKVSFEKEGQKERTLFHCVTLLGPATQCFQGIIEIP